MITPLTNKPKIFESDIGNGVIFRYFVKNTSTKRITEIDALQFSMFKNNPYYQAISLPWTIGGNDKNITTQAGDVIYGAIYKNTEMVKLYEKQMRGLSLILRNPLEYFYGRYITESD